MEQNAETLFGLQYCYIVPLTSKVNFNFKLEANVHCTVQCTIYNTKCINAHCNYLGTSNTFYFMSQFLLYNP